MVIYQANYFYYVIADDYNIVEKTALSNTDINNDTAVYTAWYYSQYTLIRPMIQPMISIIKAAVVVERSNSFISNID